MNKTLSMMIILACAALPVLSAQETVRYWYDGAGRLMNAGYAVVGADTASVKYQYDKNGNLTNLYILGQGATANVDGDDLRDVDEWSYFANLDQIGASDPDGDGLAISNELAFGSDPGLKDTDRDSANDYEEWVADTIPTDDHSFFHLANLHGADSMAVIFACSNSRIYSLQSATNLVAGQWLLVDGPANGADGGVMTMTDTNDAAAQTYRVGVSIP